MFPLYKIIVFEVCILHDLISDFIIKGKVLVGNCLLIKNVPLPWCAPPSFFFQGRIQIQFMLWDMIFLVLKKKAALAFFKCYFYSVIGSKGCKKYWDPTHCQQMEIRIFGCLIHQKKIWNGSNKVPMNNPSLVSIDTNINKFSAINTSGAFLFKVQLHLTFLFNFCLSNRI